MTYNGNEHDDHHAPFRRVDEGDGQGDDDDADDEVDGPGAHLDEDPALLLLGQARGPDALGPGGVLPALLLLLLLLVLLGAGGGLLVLGGILGVGLVGLAVGAWPEGVAGGGLLGSGRLLLLLLFLLLGDGSCVGLRLWARRQRGVRGRHFFIADLLPGLDELKKPSQLIMVLPVQKRMWW